MPEREAGEETAVRRYRPSRSWPVGALALAAAGGAVLATGTLSSNVGAGPDAAFAARIKQSVAGLAQGTQRQAGGSAAPAPGAAWPVTPPPPVGAWQIQVGAFRSTPAAEAHLRALESEVPELAGLTPTHQLRGGITRVRIAGIADETTARRLCDRILQAGKGCFVAGQGS